MSSATGATQPVHAADPQPGVLARNAFFLLLGQIGSTVLAIVLAAALARALGAADFGIYFLLVTTSTFAYVVVDWGQSAYLIREAAHRPEATGTLLGSALLFRVAAAASAIVVVALLARLLGYDARIQAYSALIVLCSLPLALSQPYSYLFRSRDRMDLEAIVTITGKATILAVTLLVLALGGHLVGVLLAQAAGGAVALLGAVLLARRIGLPGPRVTWHDVRALAVGGAPIAVFFVAAAVEPYLHAIVLSKLAPAVTVGWYGAARSIMGVLLAPATILSTSAFPQFARAAARPDDLRRAIRQMLRLLLGLGAFGAVGTYLFADLVVSSIYGRGNFHPAAVVLELFAPVLFIFFIDILLAGVVTAIGKARPLALAKLVSLGVSTALAVLLVPMCQDRFGNGGLGLVLAFGISEAVMAAACVMLVPRGALDRGTLVDLQRAVLVGAGTVGLFHWLPGGSSWVALPASLVVFAVLSLAVGLISRGDLALIAALLQAQLLSRGDADAYGDEALPRPVVPETGPRSVEATPLVSIVINNFNYARFLSQSIESALAQKHPKTEIVVVDDASSDGSPDLIRGYGGRVTAILRERNGGQGAAVNAGFAASHGEIVIFLDADDYLYPDAAARVAAAWAPGISKLQYRLHLVASNGETIDLFPAPELRFDSGDVVPLLLSAGRYETTVTSGNAFARGALERVLPMPEAEFRMGADGYLVTVTPFHGPVASTDEALGAYRLHDSNSWALRDQALGDRLRLWLQHDADKYKALGDQARAMGLRVSPSLGMRDHFHLATRLASLCLDSALHPHPDDSLMALALRGALSSGLARQTLRRRVILAAWFLAVGFLPRRLAQRLVSWRLAPYSRSPGVARLLKTVRRMAR